MGFFFLLFWNKAKAEIKSYQISKKKKVPSLHIVRSENHWSLGPASTAGAYWGLPVQVTSPITNHHSTDSQGGLEEVSEERSIGDWDLVLWALSWGREEGTSALRNHRREAWRKNSRFRLLLRRGAQHFLTCLDLPSRLAHLCFYFRPWEWNWRGVKGGSCQPVLIQELEARGLVQQHGEVQRQVQ